MHDGTHTHGHAAPEGAHDHNNEATGSNNINASKPGMDKDKLIALLKFMKEHNLDHAEELFLLLSSMKELSTVIELVELSKIISNSAEAMEAAAHGIGHAIEILSDVVDI